MTKEMILILYYSFTQKVNNWVAIKLPNALCAEPFVLMQMLFKQHVLLW